MFTWRNSMYRFKSISWLLAAAILLLTILPAHLHLHHSDTAPSSSHEHAVDVHLAIENIDAEHHENATVLPITPDVLIKKLNDNPLLAAALIMLVGLLLPVASRTLQHRPISNNLIPPSFYTIAPPLRAPPLY